MRQRNNNNNKKKILNSYSELREMEWEAKEIEFKRRGSMLNTTKTKCLTTLQMLLRYRRHHHLHNFPYSHPSLWRNSFLLLLDFFFFVGLSVLFSVLFILSYFATAREQHHAPLYWHRIACFRLPLNCFISRQRWNFCFRQIVVVCKRLLYARFFIFSWLVYEVSADILDIYKVLNADEKIEIILLPRRIRTNCTI